MISTPGGAAESEALVGNCDILPLVAEAVLGYRFIGLFKLDAGNVVIRRNFQHNFD